MCNLPKKEWKVIRADGVTYARVCKWAGEYGLTLAETLAAIVQCFDEFQDATDGHFDFWMKEAGYIDGLREGVQYPLSSDLLGRLAGEKKG